MVNALSSEYLFLAAHKLTYNAVSQHSPNTFTYWLYRHRIEIAAEQLVCLLLQCYSTSAIAGR